MLIKSYTKKMLKIKTIFFIILESLLVALTIYTAKVEVWEWVMPLSMITLGVGLIALVNLAIYLKLRKLYDEQQNRWKKKRRKFPKLRKV